MLYKFPRKFIPKYVKQTNSCLLVFDNFKLSDNQSWNDYYLLRLAQYNTILLKWYTTNNNLINDFDFTYCNDNEWKKLVKNTENTVYYDEQDNGYILDMNFYYQSLNAVINEETATVFCVKVFEFIKDNEFVNDLYGKLGKKIGKDKKAVYDFNLWLAYFSKKASQNLPVYAKTKNNSKITHYFFAFLMLNLMQQLNKENDNLMILYKNHRKIWGKNEK